MTRSVLTALMAAMLALAGGAAFAQDGADNDMFSALDANSDGQISESEFDAYYLESGLYETWDADDDGWIDEAEFADGLYDYYDVNDDGLIDEGELEVTDDPDEEGFWDL